MMIGNTVRKWRSCRRSYSNAYLAEERGKMINRLTERSSSEAGVPLRSHDSNPRLTRAWGWESNTIWPSLRHVYLRSSFRSSHGARGLFGDSLLYILFKPTCLRTFNFNDEWIDGLASRTPVRRTDILYIAIINRRANLCTLYELHISYPLQNTQCRH